MPPEIRQVVNGSAQSSDVATYRYTLPSSGSLHSLLLRAACTNGATAGRAVDIFDAIDDIRVVGDGNKVLYQLRPVEIEKVIEGLTGKGLEIVQNEAASAVQSGLFPIMFGRKLYDEEFFLPLASFKEVKLEVDYSPTIAADGGFATGTTAFDVLEVFSPSEKALPYKGTLVTRRISEDTSAASGELAKEIPTAFPYRFIAVYAFEANTEDGTDITRVELFANSRRLTLFSADWPEFLSVTAAMLGGALVAHAARLLWQDGDTVDMRHGNIRSWALSPVTPAEIGTDTDLMAFISAITGDRLTLSASIVTETTTTTPVAADTTDRRYHLTVLGLIPSFFGLIPYFMKDEPSGYLPGPDYDKLEVVMTQGGAGATVSVITQELMQL